MTRTTDYLVADHRRLHALLDRAEAEPFDAEAYAAFRAGRLRHIGIEERIRAPQQHVLQEKPRQLGPTG